MFAFRMKISFGLWSNKIKFFEASQILLLGNGEPKGPGNNSGFRIPISIFSYFCFVRTRLNNILVGLGSSSVLVESQRVTVTNKSAPKMR